MLVLIHACDYCTESNTSLPRVLTSGFYRMSILGNDTTVIVNHFANALLGNDTTVIVNHFANALLSVLFLMKFLKLPR